MPGLSATSGESLGRRVCNELDADLITVGKRRSGKKQPVSRSVHGGGLFVPGRSPCPFLQGTALPRKIVLHAKVLHLPDMKRSYSRNRI
jgi:hypothetical protein